MTDTIKELDEGAKLYAEMTMMHLRKQQDLHSENERLKALLEIKEWVNELPDGTTAHSHMPNKWKEQYKLLETDKERMIKKLGEILTIAADADDDAIAELAREGLGG